MILQPYEGTLPIKRFVTGTYTGDGAETQNIELGFQPRAVLVADSNGQMGYTRSSIPIVRGGFALPGQSVKASGAIALEVINNGFAVHSANNYALTNVSNETYYYIAFA